MAMIAGCNSLEPDEPEVLGFVLLIGASTAATLAPLSGICIGHFGDSWVYGSPSARRVRDICRSYTLSRFDELTTQEQC